jgi:hypothetical protein
MQHRSIDTYFYPVLQVLYISIERREAPAAVVRGTVALRPLLRYSTTGQPAARQDAAAAAISAGGR